jgi:hypothetical protein
MTKVMKSKSQVKKTKTIKEFTHGIHIQPNNGLCFKGRSFQSNHGKLKGLTTGYLKNKYYKEFKIENALHEDYITPYMKYENNSSENKTKSCNTIHQRMSRGRKVDKQLGDAIKWITEYSLSPNIFRYKSTVPTKITKQYNIWMKNNLPKNIFSLLYKMKLNPIATQVIVGDITFKLSTALDLLCKDIYNKYVIIEIKAINEKTMFKYNKSMTNLPITNCILNQSLIQLAATKALYHKTYINNELSQNHYTYVVNDKSCTAYQLPICLQNKSIY